MKFNEHQSRLWLNMIELIGDFRKNKIQYTTLVYSLEGALDAGEFNDQILVNEWYDHWTPLEILSATESYSTALNDLNNYLSTMEIFLKSKSCFLNQENKED